VRHARAASAAIKRGEASGPGGLHVHFLICVWQLCSVIRSAPHNCITSSAAAFASLAHQRAHVPQSLRASFHLASLSACMRVELRPSNKNAQSLCVMPTFGSLLPASNIYIIYVHGALSSANNACCRCVMVSLKRREIQRGSSFNELLFA
jgi:hypothetical protein